jgi:hypothetical protein
MNYYSTGIGDSEGGGKFNLLPSTSSSSLDGEGRERGEGSEWVRFEMMSLYIAHIALLSTIHTRFSMAQVATGVLVLALACTDYKGEGEGEGEDEEGRKRSSEWSLLPSLLKSRSGFTSLSELREGGCLAELCELCVLQQQEGGGGEGVALLHVVRNRFLMVDRCEVARVDFSAKLQVFDRDRDRER